jgi:hypothetical protein
MVFQAIWIMLTKIPKFTLDHKQFDQAVGEMDIMDELPILIAGEIIPAFAGLKVQTSDHCGECPKVLGNDHSIAVHYSCTHTKIKKPKTLHTVHYQQFNLSPGMDHTIFQVHQPAQKLLHPDQVLVAALFAATDKGFFKTIHPRELNAHVISPLLLKTQWHLLVGGHDPPALMALVKPISQQEMPRLFGLVEHYYQKATDLIDHTDDLTLQHLNTPDPTKTYVILDMLRFMFDH